MNLQIHCRIKFSPPSPEFSKSGFSSPPSPLHCLPLLLKASPPAELAPPPFVKSGLPPIPPTFSLSTVAPSPLMLSPSPPCGSSPILTLPPDPGF
ncbi:hypothetical protein TIFTF001_006698 [Ficus carica]|uniref:Uncharacterized protein n=1 Tax=Ficus carica TaxID=3494 RepID=A0AA87ZRQ4_FICCA|nr:hypothetical protein TIFTF001_006698 [Ficus carica]